MLVSVKSFLLFIALICFQFASMAQVQIGGDIDGKFLGERSGNSISMPDAHTVGIGSSGANLVRIYRWSGNSWTQKGSDIVGDFGNDNFGYSIFMTDSNNVVIGAPNYGGVSGDPNNEYGLLRIYQWNGNSWVQKGGDLVGSALGSRLGWTVSMPDKNTIAATSLRRSSLSSSSGYIFIYRWNGSSWVQKGSDINQWTSDDSFGWSLSMPDSNTIAIGDPKSSAGGSASNQVYVYTWDGSFWDQKGVEINGSSSGDLTGWSVSMPNSNTIAIGSRAYGSSGEDGQVRVFNWENNAWVQKGSDINGNAGDYFGQSVSMPNSETISIGAIGNLGSSNNTGKASIFIWDGNDWTKYGNDIIGEAAGDFFGQCVSMADSNIIAVSAQGNDGDSTQTWADLGHVRVYNLCRDISSKVIVSGDSLIAVDTNTTYQWLDCSDSLNPISSATNRVFIPTESSGSYAVVVEKNGCIDTSDCISITGLFDHKNQRETITIYPNPSSGLFTIDYPFTNESKVYTVSDINGKVVREGVINKEKSQLNLSEFVSGIYLLRIEDAVVKLVLD